jgi:hypothetical protein
MIITKNIQTKVHIDDSSLLYSGDIDAVVMDNLKQRFEGVCYMSCLVLEVVEIQQRSNFVFSKQKQDGSASCNVRMTVRGIVIKKHEMLHECVVKKIDKDGHIICKNKYSAVYIRASNALQTIKEGQTIVALAGLVKYKLFKSAISVNALPFIPIIDPTASVIYIVVVKHTNNIVKKTLVKMEEEIEKNKSLNGEVYAFFINLIYPYNSKKKYNNNGAATKSLESIANATNGTKLTISQPDWLPYDEPSVLVHNEVEAKDYLDTDELQATDDGIVITENYETVVGYMIHKYLEHMVTIRQLCTTYNTIDIVNENSNIWNIYKRHRHT